MGTHLFMINIGAIQACPKHKLHQYRAISVGFLVFLGFLKPFNDLFANIAPKLIDIGAAKLFLHKLCLMRAFITGCIWCRMYCGGWQIAYTQRY
ncbi:MAG: hypothetical protein COA46_09340 [Porticoccaceae bacterium]|nr:MAG: hypothetical protein COA46_09340 [Porticoccaceae bacterium]